MKTIVKIMLLITLLPLFNNTVLATTFPNNFVIVEPDMGKTPIIDAIKDAKTSIHLVIYVLKDKKIIDELIAAKQRGVAVNILLQPQSVMGTRTNDFAAKLLSQANIHVYWASSEFVVTHEKVLVIDERFAIIMGFNFDNPYFISARDFGIVTTDPHHIKEILQTMQRDEKYKFIPVKPKQAFQVLIYSEEAINNNIDDKLINETDTQRSKMNHLIWSPQSSEAGLLDLVKSAKHTLSFYAISFSDPAIIHELKLAAKRGVAIKAILPAVGYAHSSHFIAELSRNHVQVHYHPEYYVHAKVIIVDQGFPQQKAFIGSINLTNASIKSNRELGMITRDAKVIHQLNDVFMKDWQVATDVPMLIDTWKLKHQATQHPDNHILQ